MSTGKRILWGGLGWVLAGPIGAIIGFSLASLSDDRQPGAGYRSQFGIGRDSPKYPRTKPGDFAVSLLVLFAHVMKADKKMLKSELEYIKQFLNGNFGAENSRDLMVMFRDILKQDYSIPTICRQVKRHMDHPSRLELVHVLFGLSQADGEIHPLEVEEIRKISNYLGVSQADYDSIKAMFLTDATTSYTVLEVSPQASDQEIKRAYRRMAGKFHPDKVHHLGEDFQELAEEKFKAINQAYQEIKGERKFT